MRKRKLGQALSGAADQLRSVNGKCFNIIWPRELGPAPAFDKPREVACAAVKEDGAMVFCDRRLLNLYSTPKSGVNLKVGIEDYKPKVDNDERREWEFINCLLQAIYVAGVKPKRNQLISFRGCLCKIGLTPLFEDQWRIKLIRCNGLWYMYALLEEQQGEKNKAAEEFCYMGYKFEDYCCDASPTSGQAVSGEGSSEGGRPLSYKTQNTPVVTSMPFVRRGVPATTANPDTQFLSVTRTCIGGLDMLVGAEVDCCTDYGAGVDSYVELKTAAHFPESRRHNFQKFKLPKFWLQSHLAGVGSIICGLRSPAGTVAGLERFSTSEVPQLCREQWDERRCLLCIDKVLCFVMQAITEDGCYILRNEGRYRVWLRQVVDDGQPATPPLPQWWLDWATVE